MGSVNIKLVRRSLALFLIGSLHYLCWMSDILFVYSILMLPLIFIRDWSNKRLLVIASVFLINIPTLLLLTLKLFKHHVVETPASAVGLPASVRDLYSVVTTGGWTDIFRFNRGFIHARVQFQLWNGSFFMVLGYFILGVLAARNNFLQYVSRYTVYFRWLVPLCILLTIGLQHFMIVLGQPPRDSFLSHHALSFVCAAMQSVTAVAGNLMLVSWLMQQTWLNLVIRKLADVGKMALTNYLMQTAFGLFLFYHVGLGWFSLTTPGQNFFIALAVFLVQIAYSSLWLRYFNYGIIEWVLRMITHWRYSPLRKPSSSTH